MTGYLDWIARPDGCHCWAQLAVRVVRKEDQCQLASRRIRRTNIGMDAIIRAGRNELVLQQERGSTFPLLWCNFLAQ